MLSTTLRDIALNASHDFDLSSGTFKFTSGLDGVAQSIDVAVRMHKGEYFMDLTWGIPYLLRDGVDPNEVILGQKHAEQRAEAAYASAIGKVEGVASIVNVSVTLSGRALSVQWTVTVKFDDLATTTLSGTTLVQR